MAEEPPAKKQKTESYYKIIDGVKYNREILEQAEVFGEDGKISFAEAKYLWNLAQDGPGVTDIEKLTIKYTMETMKYTKKAEEFMTPLLAAENPPATSYYIQIDGVKYERELYEEVEKMSKERYLALDDVAKLWEMASDGPKGVTFTEKSTILYCMSKFKFTEPAKEFLSQKCSERVFLFSSESVNEGHPDKLCDQVSDAVLDACLTEDPKSKVACETVTKDNMVMVAGEITTQAKLEYEKVVRGVVAKIGFDSYVDDLSSVDSKGLCDKTCEVLVRINKQSPDIAGGVHVGKDEMDVGAGDQGIMFGYATEETADCMPLTHSVATRLGKKLTDVRKSGELWWLRPDGKTQVTIKYLQKADGSVEPLKLHTVVISTQHAEPSKATRCKEVAGYTGPDETAPDMEEMNKLIIEHVVKKTLSEIILKNGESALSLFGKFTHLYINPSGKFIIGGPQGDAGLTGRKIIIDTYGGWGAHGGGAFSGKDPTKVDRSAAYICRQMAKSVVKSGLCKRALVQLSYAIGVAKPLSLFVETYGTEQGKLTAEDITNVIKIEFDCRPGAIAMSLALREPKYQETAAYCHFGREPYTKDGVKFFEWENAKDLSKYASMDTAQVLAELKSSNYLTKWVD